MSLSYSISLEIRETVSLVLVCVRKKHCLYVFFPEQFSVRRYLSFWSFFFFFFWRSSSQTCRTASKVIPDIKKFMERTIKCLIDVHYLLDIVLHAKDTKINLTLSISSRSLCLITKD